ncbi:energy transducer TonB family protein [Bradyrhizobium murdochi]|uniref:energy transducer TonB family protein n=1 Tax=Bradyrhizobium murdochi TaxID=1038859 RepID=UPI0004060A56|nr:energy transducer TonB [Bradyrhizobium murdochi]
MTAIGWRDPDGRIGGEVTLPSVLRWTAAGLAVVALHAGVMWLTMNWPAPPAMPGGPPEAIMIELAPLTAAPEPTTADVAPGPQVTETPPDPIPAPQEKPPEEPKETTQPVEPPSARNLEVDIPELPENERADAVLTPPSKAPEPQPKRPAPKRAIPQTSAPSVRTQQRADRFAAPAPSAARVPSASAASWQSALAAHLNRHKRYPPGASQGAASVIFTIDQGGRVVSARLARSSGDHALDSEAVALARRASPVPAPPAGQSGNTLTIAVPIRFDRR